MFNAQPTGTVISRRTERERCGHSASVADMAEGEFLHISSTDTLFLYTQPLNRQTKVGGIRSYTPFTSSCALFSSWTKSVNPVLGVGTCRSRICKHWDSDGAYLGKQSLFMNRVNNFL